MFISFSQGNRKLKTFFFFEIKIFHLTSEKHLQVATGTAKEIQSLFASITTPLPVAHVGDLLSLKGSGELPPSKSWASSCSMTVLMEAWWVILI